MLAYRNQRRIRPLPLHAHAKRRGRVRRDDSALMSQCEQAMIRVVWADLSDDD